MNSKPPDDLLSAFLDRELNADEEATAQARLQASVPARQELGDYQKLSSWLKELPRQTLPPEFAAAVMRQAERETLIPLDAADRADRHSHLRPPSRRALMFTGMGAVAASVALFCLVTLSNQMGQRRAVFEPALATNLAKKVPSNVAASGAATKVRWQNSAPTAGVEIAKASSNPAPAAPAPAGSAPGRPSSALGLFGVPVLTSGAKVAPAASDSADNSAQELVFPADLKTARVGDVIEALEKVGEQVAIVRLQVLNQTAELGGLQSLLVRNTSRPVKTTEQARILRERFEAKGTVSVERRKMGKGAGGVVCVFLEGNRDELAGVLKDVQKENLIQQAQLTNTMSAAKLAQYARRPVAPAAQSPEHKSGHVQTVLNLPTATVHQILADGEPAASHKAGRAKTSRRSQRQISNALADDRSSDKESRSKNITVRLNSSAAPAPALAKRTELAPADRKQLVAAAQRSYQVFFVLDEQSVAQSEAAAVETTPPIQAPAQDTAQPPATSQMQVSRKSKTHAGHREPVVAQPPVPKAPVATTPRPTPYAAPAAPASAKPAE